MAHNNLLKIMKKNKERALEDIKKDFINCQKKYAKINLESQKKKTRVFGEKAHQFLFADEAFEDMQNYPTVNLEEMD